MIAEIEEILAIDSNDTIEWGNKLTLLRVDKKKLHIYTIFSFFERTYLLIIIKK